MHRPKTDEENILETKLRFPDYRNADPEKTVNETTKRIQKYEVGSRNGNNTEDCSYTTILSVGRQLVLNDIQSYVHRKIVIHFRNSHIMPRSS